METRFDQGTTFRYTLGFLLSLLLTFGAYLVVQTHLFSQNVSLAIIWGSACFQAWIQLTLFVQLGKEGTPKWHLIAFLFMFVITLLIVFLSLWIMKSLDYNMRMP